MGLKVYDVDSRSPCARGNLSVGRYFVVRHVAVDLAVVLSVDFPWAIELSCVAFLFRLFEYALLSFFRLAFA